MKTGLYLKLSPTLVTTYYHNASAYDTISSRVRATWENLKIRKHSGELSKDARKKLINSVNWLVYSAPIKKVHREVTNTTFDFRVNFITLTIPPQMDGMVTESKLKQLLNSFLTYSRKYCGLNSYVWKAEPHKDNRLHVHITTDTFIHWKDLRDNWNRLLKSNGLLELHFEKYGNYNPNSTDIHATKKVKNLAAYIAKYMGKPLGKDSPIKRRIWGCSQNISKVRDARIRVQEEQYWEWMRLLQVDHIRKKNIYAESKEGGEEFQVCSLYFVNAEFWRQQFNDKLLRAMKFLKHQISKAWLEKPLKPMYYV